MQWPKVPDNRKGGFALIVVLFSLVIITALFATAQKRSLGSLHEVNAEKTLLAIGQVERDLVDLAIAVIAGAGTSADTSYTITVDGREFELRFQDASGLIDLNTASPGLLQSVAGRLGLPASVLQGYQLWRQTPHRLLRVDDFLRITGANTELLSRLRSIATVHSGRRDIAPGAAPSTDPGLAGSGNSGDPTVTPGGGPFPANYLVWLRRSGTENDTAVGIIHVAPDPKQSRVLQLF